MGKENEKFQEAELSQNSKNDISNGKEVFCLVCNKKVIPVRKKIL